MTGTQNHEGLAGAAAAVEYLADVGERHPAFLARFPSMTGRRQRVHAGVPAIRGYETTLARHLLAGLMERPRFQVWGLTDSPRLGWRVPTVAITLPGRPAQEVAEHLARREIYVWNGNMYALALCERLRLEE